MFVLKFRVKSIHHGKYIIRKRSNSFITINRKLYDLSCDHLDDIFSYSITEDKKEILKGDNNGKI